MHFTMIHFNLIFLAAIASVEVSAKNLVPAHEDSICEAYVRYNKTGFVTYHEPYRVPLWGMFYKNEVRANWRRQYYTDYRVVEVCCARFKLVRISELDHRIYEHLHYSYNSNSETCIPICDPACENGYCDGPNKCQCDDNYEKSKDESHFCQPVCNNPSCINGKCIHPNICACNPGYRQTGKHSSLCEPNCENECELGHGFCQKPNICECHDGYEPIVAPESAEIKACAPICKGNCTNGACTAPNVCICDEGYVNDPEDILKCVPRCKTWCQFGTCNEANSCTCYEGYSLSSGDVCEPICSESCANGTCIAPETCSCNEGFGLTDDSRYACQPICERACINGTCTAPAVCSCHDGFKLSGDERSKHICEPHCEIPCEPFGRCVAPDTCTCYEGYLFIGKHALNNTVSFTEDSACKPICEQNCVNGYCSDPGVCSCNSGYRRSKNDSNVCEPFCEADCINGICTGPNACSCNAGYGLSENGSNVCAPICKRGCSNGFCSGPDVCTCKPGYRTSENDNSNICLPICDQACTNGFCSSPNVCTCNDGYIPSTNDSTNICKSHCDKSCGPHGFCAARGKCECNDGYRFAKEDRTAYFCEPICNVDCGNGTCASPNTCTCDEGYENNATGHCVPFCASCDNGTCVGPEICRCNDGFVLIGDRRSNKTICRPYCENCLNGNCVAPDDCQCHEGFVKSNNRTGDPGNNVGCVKACESNCNDHGICITESRTCRCRLGWKGINCDEPFFCVRMVDIDVKETTALTVVEHVNDTIVKIFENNPTCSIDVCTDGNDTLCFRNYNRSMAYDVNDRSLGCLINTDNKCRAVHEELRTTSSVGTVAGILGGIGLIVITGAMLTYLLIRKKRSAGINLDNASTIPLERGASLLLENENNL